jgi:predicted DNA-binding transcriptional regulator YafY
MPSEKKEAMLRTWELLKLIPQRAPGKPARLLLTELAARGYSVSKKTVERDLVNLSIIFPITCNEESKPYQWFWAPNASLNLPGVALTEALSLVLAEQTLLGLMHKSLLAPLQGRLDAAKRLLSEAKGHNAKAGWTDKICAVPRDLMLRPPKVNASVLEEVQDALLGERQLDIEYRSLMDAAASWRTVNPRALLLKGSVMYLLADKSGASSPAAFEPVKQYALHRIRSTRAAVKRVTRSEFNLADYRKAEEHEVGKRRGVRVRLRITADLAKILRETPLALKQRIKVSADTIVVEAALRDTPALQRWILGHGSAVEVLGPAALRTAIRSRIEAAAAQY